MKKQNTKNNTPARQKRFRDYGFVVGMLPSGKRNSISDVSGVRVGHQAVGNTGVTIIDPGVSDLFKEKLPAAIAVGNGFGKLAGFTQVEELGTLEAPIALTNTLAVGPVMRGVVDLVLKNETVPTGQAINAVVGEINDGRLNDIHQNRVTGKDVFAAYGNRSADFALGSVGAGKSARAFSWKGGIGSASREVFVTGKKYTVGVLVQTNFGGALTVLGLPVGRELGKTDFDSFIPTEKVDGSCMIVLGTDAPLSSRQLERVAKRALLGMVRTGSILSHSSGDYCVAFSTSRVALEGSGAVGKSLKDEMLNPFFLAAVESVEESIYDALFLAKTTKSDNGSTMEALPKDKVVDLLEKYGRSK